MRIEWVAVGLLMASIEGCGGNAVVLRGDAFGPYETNSPEFLA
jgi:hypothetical protein